MTTAEIEITYGGPGVKSGKMDVRELAPALLAIGDLFQRANTVLNGDRATVSVSVRADLERGSFTVHLQVLQDLIEKAKTLLSSDEVKAAQDLIKVVGFGKTATTSVIGLIKKLKGKKPKEETKLEDGTTRLVIGDNNIIIVQDAVARLYRDEPVRDSASRIVRPLERPDIDEVRFAENGEVVEVVRDEDIDAFRQAALPEGEPGEGPVIMDSEREAILEIIRPSFDRKLPWTFHDGTAQFPAPVRDEAFLEKVERGEILFGDGDRLRVRIRAVTTEGEKLKTRQSVTAVLEVTPRPKQLPLLPASDAD